MDSTTSDPHQQHQIQAHPQPPPPVTSSSSPSSSPSSPQSSYNSSFGSNSGRKLINNSASSITSLVPGGVVTTQNISTVIRPKENTNSLQFVKIQTPELSKKAVEQIRIAEERNISKEKIKEVEEEWQNNLLDWKSKRRQQLTQTFEQAPNDLYETTDISGGRKVKTFAEMLEERAKSGNRLGFHLQRYLGTDDDDNNGESQLLDNRETTRESFSNGPMNSTPQHDVRSASPNTPKSTPILGVDTKTNEVSAKSDNDSDNSVSEEEEDEDEEEEQEEEEQKHLQRIAFEAKLKVFEELTMPSTKKPEIAPKRITRVPIPPPKSIPPPPPLPQHKAITQPKMALPPKMTLQPKIIPHSKVTPPSAVAPISNVLVPSSTTPTTPQTKMASPPTAVTPPSATTPSSTTTSPSTTTTPPPYSTTSPYTTASSPEEKPIMRVVSPPRTKSPPRVAPQPKLLAPQPREVPPPKIAPPPASLNMKEIEQNMPKNRCLTSQPTPESLKNISSQRKSRDDKDRTVLSVSGKKRCSSCKEELGRGAAAFVVESLALVYHTNCFRCSVCHVNLSNGFRGVDVRVHAGALHCQNCYSKDGLNYSRV